MTDSLKNWMLYYNEREPVFHHAVHRDTPKATPLLVHEPHKMGIIAGLQLYWMGQHKVSRMIMMIITN